MPLSYSARIYRAHAAQNTHCSNNVLFGDFELTTAVIVVGFWAVAKPGAEAGPNEAFDESM